MSAFACPRDVTPEPARIRDCRRLRELLEAAVPDCHPDTARSISQTWPSFTVVRDSLGRVVAAGALQRVDDERAEIRGLVVDPIARGQGLGHSIVLALIRAAQSQGLAAVCVTRRPEFFRRFGFCPTPASATLWLSRRKPIKVDRAVRPRVAMHLDVPEVS